MFKRLIFVILLVTVVLSGTITATAGTVASSGIAIMVNNYTITQYTPAVRSNNTVMAPAEELVKALGGTFYFDSASMTAIVKHGGNELLFRLDDNVARFNGKYFKMPAPMQIINLRFMIPAEFTANKLGAECYMGSKGNTLMIFKPSDGKIAYNVVAGDTLWIISQVFKTTVNSIKQLNGLSGDMIYPGQRLVIKNFMPNATVIPAYTTAGATIRKGAGFNYDVVGYLKAWTAITITGKVGDWYKVATPKGTGYIYYTVIGINQDSNGFNTAGGTMLNGKIPVDTSRNYIRYNSYTVQKGDYIWAVSERFGIPASELASANGISLNSPLYPGQVLKIPVHVIAKKNTLANWCGEILDWFMEGQYMLPIGKTAKLIDLETGKSFFVKRTAGASHADTETLTAQDTKVMKEIFGGTWTWAKRAFILEVDGRRLAVSVSGMPHAGVDGVAFLQNVSVRSGGWGYGPNYDAIAGNGMEGHFDLYFLNSLTHSSNAIDKDHQYNVLRAGGLH